MALMTWTDAFSVGVKAMDKQHKGLVKALNELHAAMMEKQGKAVTGNLLKALVKYTREHFSTEEALMRRAQYPQFAAHCAQHKGLTAQVEDFVGRYERGETTLNVDLLTFLREWLMTHIQKADREYGPWLNAHGVK